MSKEEKKEKKKVETFNQLDERFQIHEHHDPNHIFPEEYEMIKKLKEERPSLEKCSDKFLVTFLCARRHDIPETLKLLDKYYKKAEEIGADVKPEMCTLKDEELTKHLEAGVILVPKHATDKYDRMLEYVYVSRDKPKERPPDVLYKYGFWETNYVIENEPLKNIRNGCILVIDFKGFGLANVDLSPKGIDFSKALSGCFPKRIRKVYLVNGGWLLKIISEAAKLLISKKLVDRMEVGNVEGLKNYISDENLLTEYNGKFKFNAGIMVQEIRDTDKENAEKNKDNNNNNNDINNNHSPSSAEKSSDSASASNSASEHSNVSDEDEEDEKEKGKDKKDKKEKEKDKDKKKKKNKE